MSGFLHGHDAIDDQEEYEDDPGIESVLGETPKARAMGDWLRDFSDQNRLDLKQFLHRQAMHYRNKLKPNDPVIMNMDSTSHVQHGNKMEGLAWNYKKEWCLDSLVTFDEIGLAHGMELRPGNTHSSNGAELQLEEISSGFLHQDEKYFRADSAYCNESVLRTCLRLGYRFTITAHENMGWQKDKSEITNWKPWVYSEEEIEKSKKRKRSLPECEVGHYLYQPSWSEELCQKLKANHVYGLIALIAHNFLRTIAILANPDKPNFAKKLRRKLIYISGRIVKHARTLRMKIPEQFKKEVERLKEAWQLKPESAFAFR